MAELVVKIIKFSLKSLFWGNNNNEKRLKFDNNFDIKDENEKNKTKKMKS